MEPKIEQPRPTQVETPAPLSPELELALDRLRRVLSIDPAAQPQSWEEELPDQLVKNGAGVEHYVTKKVTRSLPDISLKLIEKARNSFVQELRHTPGEPKARAMLLAAYPQLQESK